MGVLLKMLCTPKPIGFADQTIPFLNGYFIGNIPNIFRQTHLEKFHQPGPCRKGMSKRFDISSGWWFEPYPSEK